MSLDDLTADAVRLQWHTSLGMLPESLELFIEDAHGKRLVSVWMDEVTAGQLACDILEAVGLPVPGMDG